MRARRAPKSCKVRVAAHARARSVGDGCKQSEFRVSLARAARNIKTITVLALFKSIITRDVQQRWRRKRGARRANERERTPCGSVAYGKSEKKWSRRERERTHRFCPSFSLRLLLAAVACVSKVRLSTKTFFFFFL